MKNIVLIIAVIVAILLLMRFVSQKVIYFQAVKDMNISEIQEVETNGSTQKILIEEKEEDSPILIMVHGGPGLPIPFGVGFRGQFPQLTEKFMLVQWDQYGTGINYASDISNYNIDDYVNMLRDIIDHMDTTYPDRKLFLFGMSWGTILNTKVANLIPEKIDGVISYGQFTNIPIWKEAMYDELSNLEFNDKEKDSLFDARHEISVESFKQLLDMASNKTDLYYYKGKEASNWDFYMHCFHVMLSPDYSLLDAIHAYSNPSGDELMYQKVFYTDMMEEQSNTSIPVLIMQGEEDYITPVSYNKELIENNKNMKLTVFKNAGHIPTNASYEQIFLEIEKFCEEIINN